MKLMRGSEEKHPVQNKKLLHICDISKMVLALDRSNLCSLLHINDSQIGDV